MNVGSTLSSSMLMRPKRSAMVMLACRAAVRDLLIDWRSVICVVLGFTAVLAPLLVLFGLKFGILDTLRRDILSDPRTLEVTLRGNHQLDEAWFEKMAGHPSTLFIVPKTRSIAATIYVQNTGGLRIGRAELAELIPTAIGDPLLRDTAQRLDANTVVLSASLAKALGVSDGDTVVGFVTRTVVEGRRERADVGLLVEQVLDPADYTRLAVFAPLNLLSAVEDFRDGYAVDAMEWPGQARTHRRSTYASARLYAKDLPNLPILVNYIETAEGIPVSSQAAEVAGILGLDKSLSTGFWIVAGMAGAGFFFSLAASLWSNVERKRSVLGTLMLIGFSRQSLLIIPIVQSVMIGAVSIVSSFILYTVAEAVVDKLFIDVVTVSGSDICVLLPHHIAIVVGATLLFCVVAAIWATSQIFTVGVAHSLRER